MVQNPSLDVLVIEDDPDTCENLRDILELDAHTVTVAHSAAAGLSSPGLRTASVILLDWKLPDATALEILPRLRETVPEAEVIIITGHGDFDHAVAALREGAADYLLKPINPEALRSSLRRLSQTRWLTLQKARSDAIFRNLVQAAPCLIVILRRDLSIVYFSPYAERLTGYAAEEVKEQNFANLFLQPSAQSGVPVVVDKIFSRRIVNGEDTVIRCRDGAVRWILWNAQLLDDLDGEPTIILAVGQDITEQKRAIEQLLQSERLAAIGEAMTGLAHESRNALQRSQASLELLGAEVSGHPRAMKLVGRIQDAQNHLHQLYEEVRQYAAPMNIERHSCSLIQLVQETWSYLEQELCDRDAELVVDPQNLNPGCRVDRFLMLQVLRNILDNALAACPDPVRITVCSRPIQLAGQDWTELSIQDNGPGLNAEQRQRIFEPFFTTKMRGTGLGMTLSQRIIAAHGGHIAIGEGPGMRVVIQLPTDHQTI